MNSRLLCAVVLVAASVASCRAAPGNVFDCAQKAIAASFDDVLHCLTASRELAALRPLVTNVGDVVGPSIEDTLGKFTACKGRGPCVPPVHVDTIPGIKKIYDDVRPLVDAMHDFKLTPETRQCFGDVWTAIGDNVSACAA